MARDSTRIFEVWLSTEKVKEGNKTTRTISTRVEREIASWPHHVMWEWVDDFYDPRTDAEYRLDDEYLEGFLECVDCDDPQDSAWVDTFDAWEMTEAEAIKFMASVRKMVDEAMPIVKRANKNHYVALIPYQNGRPAKFPMT